MKGNKEKDITQKTLERYNDVFADIINVLLFDGRRVVTEDSLTEAMPGSVLKMDGKIRTQYRDIAKYWHNSKIKLSMFGLENQTKPEKRMPLRVFGYDGAEYVRQARKENIKEAIYPVITLVLYFGYNGRWSQPKSLFELLDIDERIKPYVNDFKMNLFEIAYMDEEKISLFKSDFRILVDYLHQIRTNNSYNPKDYIIKHIDELLTLMSVMTGDKRFEDSINEANEKEARYMCEVLDIIENRGIEKGLEQGLEKGRQEGADMVSKLNELLLNEGNIDKLRRANTDKNYRHKLLKEYKILQ